MVCAMAYLACRLYLQFYPFEQADWEGHALSVEGLLKLGWYPLCSANSYKETLTVRCEGHISSVIQTAVHKHELVSRDSYTHPGSHTKSFLVSLSSEACSWLFYAADESYMA